ncbi:MAG: radical SAM family heme chaperone HemW [Hyphomicrobiaceae bacterium]
MDRPGAGGRTPVNPDAAGFGVYVHWPFCASKCPYCDFNSHVRLGGVDEAAFRDAFVAEIEATAHRIGGRRVDSIFLGGGTPSLMTPATVAAILDAIARRWQVGSEAEITLEANPSSVEASRFAGYRAAGVNRVSLGVQALADADLKALGRLHTAAEARRALDIAAATFPRFSFDLIYARPGQTPADWAGELAEALALGSRHISLYQLTIEDGTPFAALHAAGRLVPPEPDVADALFRLTDEMTRSAGLAAYEISNHATAGEESRHNVLYWRYGEYAGIGPGAHGRLIVDGVRRATATERQPEAWRAQVSAAGLGLVEDAALEPAEQADEALLMGLRLTEGISLDRLAAIGAVRPASTTIAELAGMGLIELLPEDRLRATPAGRFVLNEIVLRLSAAFAPTCAR